MDKKIVALILCICLVVNNVSLAFSMNSTSVHSKQIMWTEEKSNPSEKNAESEVDNKVENNNQSELQLNSKSAILMEAETGQVLYEHNADEQLSPASITKIMTLILIFDALENGKIHMDDEVVTSAHAKSMGGSQVFLEEGETQTVETMIKCIVIASGNDASVAMAEHIAGSEEAFVRQMNERAKQLGMVNTVFEDCCGLTDSKTHVSSARDVALMSKELITKYPKILEYSSIWMETITHVTQKGEKEFVLSNTNKLLKMSNSFEVTGLKTGSTSLAKYCLSATAKKDGISLIAVIMAAPDYKSRFSEAQKLLNYGYANCYLYTDTEEKEIEVPIQKGKKDSIRGIKESSFGYLASSDKEVKQVKKKVMYKENLQAPIKKGTSIGKIVYTLNGTEIGTVQIIASDTVKKADMKHYMKKMWKLFGV